jgi:hypothetical protein
MVVEAGNKEKRFTAGFAPLLLQSNLNLFEGLQAVRGEGGGRHRESLHAARRDLLQEDVRVGLDPGGPSEAALKGHRVVAFCELQGLPE